MSDINDIFGNEESGFEAVFGGEFPANIDYETDVNNKPSIGGEEVSGSHTIDYYGGVTSTEMETALETKADISDLPAKTSDLDNDSGYITNAVNDLANYYLKSETYTQAEVNSLIGAITTIDIRVVQELPTEDISTTTIYLVPSTSAGTSNAYDEYIYVNQNWEMIGTTAVDLSDYYTKSEVNALIPTKVSVLQNDSGYITSSVNDLANYYNKTTIDGMLIMDVTNTIFGGE